ncbi:MAG: D-tyrosyl-tRNA(Tyr) deacylase [Gammaproteobacteria bacterium]|nr:D-tyrosyl-tRNA(Tyr) deacylase [Gammaproteobacteria bacterium]
MIGLLQRVTQASVTVGGACVGAIERGVLVFIGVQPADSTVNAERLVDRMLGYRVFADADGRMNRSVRDVHGGLLLISQFTLAADTTNGTRASFTHAAPPGLARARFEHLVAYATRQYSPVATGHFGADMQVALVNDGPVTFWLEA